MWKSGYHGRVRRTTPAMTHEPDLLEQNPDVAAAERADDVARDQPRQVAIVTGGSRGIGRAIVVKLASLGFTVHFTYVSNEERASQLAREVEAAGGRAKPMRVDSRDLHACTAFVEATIAETGRLDVLVNNAAITNDRLLPMMAEKEW